MLLEKNNIKKIIPILALVIFFYLNFNIIEHGLPLFQNSDETSFTSSSLSFLGLITDIEFRLFDPIVAPLLNILLILKIILINEFFINSLSLIEIKNKIYFNPELIVYYGRLASLTTTTFSFLILLSIFKKLKINFYIFFPIFFSLLISLFATDISTRNGKNSYYLFFFLTQFYFFIKYLIKIEKFNFKSYIIFALLGSLAWGVNYWASIISIYAILILHYSRYKFLNFNYLISFGLIFLFLGFIPNILFSEDKILDHLFHFNIKQNSSVIIFFKVAFNKFFESLMIISITELISIIFLPLTIFYLCKNFKNKKIFIITLILLFEPIILISISGSVIPQLRYFSGLICLIAILLAIILNDLSDYYNTKKVIIIFFIINSLIISHKFITYNKINNLVKVNHNFYPFLNSNLNINASTLYIIDGFNYFSHRKNLNNLNFYLKLHQNKILKNKKHLRDNQAGIIRKIKKTKETESKIILHKNLKDNLNTFNSNNFIIDNIDFFFEIAKDQYEYIVIMDSDMNSNISKFVSKEFLLIKSSKKKDPTKNYFDHFLTILDYASRNVLKTNLDKKFIYGDSYLLYKMN